MRSINILAGLLLLLTLAACSGVETTPSNSDTFAAAHYRYYVWRSEPLPKTTRSSDIIYVMDPIIRQQVDAILQSKGYMLDKQRAQFSVDYLYAQALREGAKSAQASNITPYPSVTPNRQVNQAVVDNANALGGVQETRNIAVQFNDTGNRAEVWRVVITKVVENVNTVDSAKFTRSLSSALEKAMRELPEAS